MSDLDLTNRDGYVVEADVDELTGFLHLVFKDLGETETIASIIIEPEKAVALVRSLSEVSRVLTPPGTPGLYKSRLVFDKQNQKGRTEFSPI